MKDLTFNAGLGAGLPVGICEDVSYAVTMLESFSVCGAKECLYAINCERDISYTLNIVDNEINVEHGRVLFEGISAIDYFIAGPCNKVVDS